MTTQAEQYGLYISLIIPILGSVLPLRKAYYLNKYIHETDPSMKIMIAGRANLSESEKLASNEFLKYYRSVPRRLSVVPVLFIAFELARTGYGKIKKWYK